MQKVDVMVTIGITIAILVAIALVTGTMTYVSIAGHQSKLQAYRECIAANERMATMLAKADTETLRVSSLPSCHM